MLKKILLVVLVIVVLFLGYVITRPNLFHYERNGIINAPSEKIFPYLANFKMGSEWSPYEKMDPNLKKTFGGTDGQEGATMEFEGNSNVGSGKLEIVKIIPNDTVRIKLTMLKPFRGDNLVEYRLTPNEKGPGTQFTWAMSGEAGFMGKLISVFINCEKMVGAQFEAGINNLKTIVESR